MEIFWKAEAMKKYGSAAIVEMLCKAYPEIAKSVAEPLSKVDKITMYGEGNNAKLVGDIVNTASKVISGVSESFGIDAKKLTITVKALPQKEDFDQAIDIQKIIEFYSK